MIFYINEKLVLFYIIKRGKYMFMYRFNYLLLKIYGKYDVLELLKKY